MVRTKHLQVCVERYYDLALVCGGSLPSGWVAPQTLLDTLGFAPPPTSYVADVRDTPENFRSRVGYFWNRFRLVGFNESWVCAFVFGHAVADFASGRCFFVDAGGRVMDCAEAWKELADAYEKHSEAYLVGYRSSVCSTVARVVAVSSNIGPFGHRNVVLMTREGFAWDVQVSASSASMASLYSGAEVEIVHRLPDATGRTPELVSVRNVFYECPETRTKAPAQVVREVWGGTPREQAAPSTAPA